MCPSVFPTDLPHHPSSIPMKKLTSTLLTLCLTLAAFAQQPAGEYRNPVIPTSLPDPTVIKAPDGYYYLYATENIRNLPIYRSKNLVDWDFVTTAFTRESRPKWNPKGNLWAPDINYINGRYVLYYAKSEWGGEWTCGIGVAIVVSECYNVMSIIVLLVREFLILDGAEIAVHGAFQSVAHGIYLIGPGARLARESRAVSIVGLCRGKGGIGSMFPHHAPVIHHLIVKRLVSDCQCLCQWREHKSRNKKK